MHLRDGNPEVRVNRYQASLTMSVDLADFLDLAGDRYVVAVIVVDVQETVGVDAVLERVLVRAAIEELRDRPGDALRRDLRVCVDVPRAEKDRIGWRHDHLVVERRRDR